MVFVDDTYAYRAVNQAYCDEHQRTKEEIVGHTVAELFGEEAFQTTLRPPMDRCLWGERVTFDFWWHSPSRGHRHVDARYDPFFEADGSVSGVLVDARDTTDRKRIEEQLERSNAALQAANRELEMFSDSLAHDLKNPLLTVTQFSVYLTDALVESLNDEQQDYLTRIRAAGRHMTHIIDDLRDLADVRRVEISLEEVDMSALAHEIIDELRALAPRRKVQFDAGPEITAIGDKTLLRLLLTNLLQNSWEVHRT
jgi:PAS domain S-box-containing protein